MLLSTKAHPIRPSLEVFRSILEKDKADFYKILDDISQNESKALGKVNLRKYTEDNIFLFDRLQYFFRIYYEFWFWVAESSGGIRRAISPNVDLISNLKNIF